MQTNSRNKIKAANEQQLHERLKILTTPKESDHNPINDIIEGSPNTTPQPKEEVLAEEVSLNSEQNIVETNDHKAAIVINTEVEAAENLSSLQDRFGVRKIKRPIKDAQLTARIESSTLKRFKEIVKMMYFPDKPNINETVTQIIRAFVEEYDKNNGKKQ
jgi:hypothetical protein